MFKYYIFILAFIPQISCAQSLMEALRFINKKYLSCGIVSYDIFSTHKSLISDTIKYSYSSQVIINPYNQNDSIKDFICTFNGNPFYVFKNEELLNYDTIKRSIESQPIETPYKILKRGEIKWVSFSPLIFKNSLIDTLKWNDSGSDYWITKDNDTLIIEMCNTYLSTPIFFEDDPLIGSTKIILKINLTDTLLISYEEVINISKKPDITRFIFSNFKFHNNSEQYDSILSNISNYSSNFKKIVKQNLFTDKIKFQQSLYSNFNDTFIMYNLNRNSIRIRDLDADYYIIDFWFSGCISCINASKILNELIKTGLPNNLKIIGINYINGSPALIKEYVNQHHLLYDQFYLKSRNEIKFLDWYGAPTIILYNRKERRVVDYIEGINRESEKVLRNFITLKL